MHTTLAPTCCEALIQRQRQSLLPRQSLGCAAPAAWCCRSTPACHRQSLRVLAHAAESAVKSRSRPGENKGFVEEMRFVAMRLHTKDQAPKEGGKEAAKQPFAQWQPTREGYLRFLVESKAVFDTLEDIMAKAPRPEYAHFQNTGLERGAALAKDISWFHSEYGLEAPQLQEDGPGAAYSQLLRQLAEEDPPAFICHYYNVYFAHTAGGRMIGKKVSSMVLDGAELAFYKYERDLEACLAAVREQLNSVAQGWTREEKDHCLQETEKSFQYSGGLLRTIMGAAH